MLKIVIMTQDSSGESLKSAPQGSEGERAPAPEITTAPKSTSKILWIVLGLVLVIVAAAAVFAFDKGFFNAGGDDTAILGNTPSEESDIAARVNKAEITNDQVAARVQLILSNTQAQGTQITPDLVVAARQQALQQLINETLILQAAQDSNIAASDEAVQAQYDTFASSFPSPEQFQQALSDNNATEQEIKADITRQLTIQQYIDENTDSESIVVTDEEVKNLYDQYSEQGEIPAIDEVRGQLEQQLRQQKLNAQIDQLIQKLADAANIEIL